MNQIRYAIQLVFFSVLVLSSATPAYASPRQDAAVIYLPIIRKDRPVINDAVKTIEPSAVGSDANFHTPMDATPDPDGNQFYFTALSAQGAGVFRVPAAGGAVVTLAVGAPLTTPVGLAVSTDGQRIFVADTHAVVTEQAIVSTSAVTQTGALFTLSSSGGTPTLLAGTAHTAPRGLTVVKENNVDMIYFTGSAPDDGQPAVMKIPADGGTLTVLEKGQPLVAPAGIAVSKTGDLYVADQAAADNGLGALFRFKAHADLGRPSHNERLANYVRMGEPAGITLTLDESLVLVSTLDTVARTSQVLVVNTTTLDQAIVNKVIGVNHTSGGLHRAHNNNVMAWCGVTAGTGGQGIVYRVGF